MYGGGTTQPHHTFRAKRANVKSAQKVTHIQARWACYADARFRISASNKIRQVFAKAVRAGAKSFRRRVQIL